MKALLKMGPRELRNKLSSILYVCGPEPEAWLFHRPSSRGKKNPRSYPTVSPPPGGKSISLCCTVALWVSSSCCDPRVSVYPWMVVKHAFSPNTPTLHPGSAPSPATHSSSTTAHHMWTSITQPFHWAHTQGGKWGQKGLLGDSPSSMDWGEAVPWFPSPSLSRGS